MQASDLILRPATFAEVQHATRTWHYTRTCATANLSAFAVLERATSDGPHEFVGVITYGSGASPSIGSPFGCSQRSVRELTRIALRPGHRTPVSRIIRISAMLLGRQRRSLRACVSYADSGQGHHGGVYQAAGWHYVGPRPSHGYRIRRRVMHPRSVASKYARLAKATKGQAQSVPWLRRHVDPRAARVQLPPKHKYIWLWDRRLLPRISAHIRPYPKRPALSTPPPSTPPRAASISSDAPTVQVGQGGATPTAALSPSLGRNSETKFHSTKCQFEDSDGPARGVAKIPCTSPNPTAKSLPLQKNPRSPRLPRRHPRANSRPKLSH